MKRVFLAVASPSITMVCCILLGCGSRGTGDANGLEVRVFPSKETVRVGEWFDVTLRVRNMAETNQYFYAYNCSWWENWKSDDTNVVLAQEVCTYNFPARVNLKPSAAYNEAGKMAIIHPVLEHKLAFRMGFTPCIVTNEYADYYWGKTSWSKEVEINIAP